MRAVRTALILAVVMLSVAVIAPMFSDHAEGAPADGDVVFTVVPGAGDVINIRVGDSKVVYITAYNTYPDTLTVRFTGVVFDHAGMYWSGDDEPVEIANGETYMFSVTVTAERYAAATDLIAEFNFLLLDPSDGTHVHVSVDSEMNILPRMASENEYNKIMGIWYNPLPAPFDTAVYAALVTFLLWLMIALLVSSVLVPLIVPLIVRHDKQEHRDIKKRVWLPLFVLIILFGLTECMNVIGAGEYIITVMNSVAGLTYVLLGALIAWRVYSTISEAFVRRSVENNGRADRSVLPLLLMIGRIVISMVTVGAILAVLGFDLMIIVTGAGVIGIAISLGAQSTLSQFFSGLTLLINRPFKEGDLVMIDGRNDVLKVIKVGFMMTAFKNWSNSEIITMPNGKVASSVIINVTTGTNTYRVSIDIGVVYGTDIELAKSLALEAMAEHPRIVKDGSEERPKVRFQAFGDSAIMIRVSGYVDHFEDNGSITSEVRESIYRKYRGNGIEIAHPQMDVRIKNNEKDEKKDS